MTATSFTRNGHDLIRFSIIEDAITPEQIGLIMYRASRGTENPPSLKWCYEHVLAGLAGRIRISDAVAFFAIHLKVQNRTMPRAAPLG